MRSEFPKPTEDYKLSKEVVAGEIAALEEIRKSSMEKLYALSKQYKKSRGQK